MCGIAGIVRFDDQPIEPDRLDAMLARLLHRGPDGQGRCMLPRCALAHARLAILDPPGGHQPMYALRCGQHSPLHVVFNGEIYNHRELRRQLEQLGHRFTSDHSDTEVVLLGYRQWGEELPQRLEGMFALAVWDHDAQRLFLARDRMGKKPLYVMRREGECLFASLVSALAAGLPAGQPLRVDADALLTFLRYGYPFTRAMIQGVEEILPAHWMSIDAHGHARLERYWQPPAVAGGLIDAANAVDALHETLAQAVSARLEADAPLGCFLSGGIDSSVIAALAQQAMRERGRERLRTFSVAMPAADYDESAHAQAVAQHIGSCHTVLEARPDHVVDDLNHLMKLLGEPTADSSILPTYWLCRAARQHVKVALSGDGGDELFGGYDRYRALRLLERHRWWLKHIPPAWLADVNPRSTRARLRRLVESARAGTSPARQYHRMIHLFTDAQVRQLGPDSVRQRIDDANDRGEAAPGWPSTGDEPARQAMRWDLAHYLPFELLRKLDRASMASALEVRCPMLDAQVCELAARLPTHVLMPAGRPKGLLRELAGRLVSPAIARRPKRGFAIPIGRWFNQSLKESLAGHLFDGTLSDMGLDLHAVRRYFEEHTQGRADHTHRLFALLELSLWWRWVRSG